jgi:hypothetical protein
MTLTPFSLFQKKRLDRDFSLCYYIREIEYTYMEMSQYNETIC